MHDTIIVGAGSAGCVLANRLTEDGSRRVLLLEAGGTDRRKEVPVPVAFAQLFKTECDWDYSTAPEPYLDERELYWPRGRLLGGSSSINAMIYIRGNRRDYDDWAAQGCEGWGWDDVLPLFKRSQDQAWGASAFHGAGGLLRVEDQRSPNPISLAIRDAGVGIGLGATEDFNGAEQDGFGFYQVTQKRGKRWSSATAFLKPARRRSNLTVRTDVLATRLLVEGGRVTGVEIADLKRGGATERLEAAEVIVSAGAINSPQLLLLSGIGPAADLEALGIEVVLDLPGVGRHLQDHPAVGVVYETESKLTLDNAETLGNLLRYVFLRRGPFTSVVAESGGFVRTREGLDRPDLQFHCAPSYYEDHGLTEPEGSGISIGPTLVQVASRGFIKLRSADPTEKPHIQPNYLAEQVDVDALIAGVRLGRQLGEHEALAPYRGQELWPGQGVETDAELHAFLKARVEGLYHPTSTCKMGVDDECVVDPQLRVRGVEGLRVIDASIMPSVVGGNTNAPTMMIAEKGAEMILAGR